LINKRTVFVLGAGASCPYGYPSGSRLRELICYESGFLRSYVDYLNKNKSLQDTKDKRIEEIKKFIKAFNASKIKSIDVFMANNPKLAPIGKYIIAYEVFRAERDSRFGEEARRKQEWRNLRRTEVEIDYIRGTPDFQGGDWYFHLYNRLIEGLVGNDALPDFSNGNLSFITFNYDRSLEYFLYDCLINSFTEVREPQVAECLKKLRILHVYGQIVPLKWQNSEQGVDYRPEIDETLLQKSSANIKTIYEQKESPELDKARKLLEQSEQIFLLGFGYAKENIDILQLPEKIGPNSYVYGTALGLENGEINGIKETMIDMLIADPVVGKNKPDVRIKIENMDCLKLLRNYL